MDFTEIVNMSDRELEEYVHNYYSNLEDKLYQIENPSFLIGKDGFINYQIEVYKSYRDSFK